MTEHCLKVLWKENIWWVSNNISYTLYKRRKTHWNNDICGAWNNLVIKYLLGANSIKRQWFILLLSCVFYLQCWHIMASLQHFSWFFINAYSSNVLLCISQLKKLYYPININRNTYKKPLEWFEFGNTNVFFL